MKKKDLFFSIYNEEEIDKDLELETIANNMQELERFFNKSKRTLHNLGIKKQKDLRIYVKVDGKTYLIIVDKV